MSDIDRLTVVVGLGLILIMTRLPEPLTDGWGLPRLMAGIAMHLVLLVAMAACIFLSLGWLR